jgi:Fic family protein
LCSWHRTLMTASPTPQRYIGTFRDEQGWIGGTSPLDAHLVPPPPGDVAGLIEDLVAFVNRDDVDPIAQAAISHAQFEVIHPFGDGNGRIGRVLIAWVLARRLALVTPPAVSTRIAADVGGYSAGLTLFRFGDHDQWVRWFADAVSGAGREQRALVTAVDDLRRSWRERLGAERDGRRRLRRTATAWRVLELLARLVVLTSRQVADELGVPDKTAHAALHELADAGILTPVSDDREGRRGRPTHVYAAIELLGLVGSTPRRA